MIRGSTYCWTGSAALALLLMLSPTSSSPVAAQSVVFDGSFSERDLGGGPLYDILTSDGRFSLDNQSVFYSFEQFSLGDTEIANFANGAAQNIVSRVVGGVSSSISGTINAGANFYFINPSGVVIHNGATINVSGSFSVSSRDALEFDNGLFSVAQPDQFQGASLAIIGDPSGFSGGTSPGDITVSDIDLALPAAESILLEGGNVFVQDSQIFVTTTDDTPAGTIFLVADGSVLVDNTILSANAELGSTGNAGVIFMDGASIRLDNGTQLQAGTFGTGRAGIVWLLTPDDGEVVFDNQSTAFSTVETGGDSLNGGLDNITGMPFHILVRTGNLTLNNQSQLQTLIRDGASGSAGWIGILADTVTLNNSAVFSDITENAAPDSIAGAVGFIVDDLFLNQSLISTSILSDGQAGVIFIEAAGGVLLENGSSILSAVDDGVTATTNPDFAGAIDIIASNLILADASSVATTNFGTGAGGNITVQTDALALSNASVISSETNNGTAGDIAIASQFLILEGDSNVSTFATTGGDGGNIQLDIFDVLFATPGGDNNIVASAPAGAGGNITFSSQLLLRNIAPREADFVGSNDITASGVVDGEVGFSSGTQDSNPVQEQVTLPTDLVDAAGLIAQGCAAGNLTAAQDIGELVVTGRGGVPPSPGGQVGEAGFLPGLVTAPINGALTPPNEAEIPELTEIPELEDREDQTAADPITVEPVAVVEAQGWMYGDEGEVVLMAAARTVTPMGTGWSVPVCGDVF